VLRAVPVSSENAHSTDKHRHLRRGQRQQLRLVNQQFLGRDAVFSFEVVAEPIGHRFEDGDVAGHVLGNLVIAGLAAEAGDFLEGLDAAARSLGVRGRVLPATTEAVVLEATTVSGPVRGQVAVEHATGIERIGLTPPDAAAPKEATEAIAAADQIVLCPGSLFTSLLAAAVVPDIREALSASTARRVYVSNLRTTPETAGFDVAAHVRALADHGVAVDVVLCHPDGLPVGDVGVPVMLHPVATPSGLAHSPALLSEALVGLL